MKYILLALLMLSHSTLSFSAGGADTGGATDFKEDWGWLTADRSGSSYICALSGDQSAALLLKELNFEAYSSSQQLLFVEGNRCFKATQGRIPVIVCEIEGLELVISGKKGRLMLDERTGLSFICKKDEFVSAY